MIRKELIAIVFLSAMYFCLNLSTFVFAYQLPDTGQHTCYDDQGNEITCPEPGESSFSKGEVNIITSPDKIAENSYLGDIAVDSSNQPHLVWKQLPENIIKYRYLDNKVWSSPVNISPNLPENIKAASPPKMVIDKLDRVHVVYAAWRRANYGGSDIYYTMYNGEEWITPINLTEDIQEGSTYYPGYPDVSVDKNNNPHVVYGYFGLYYTNGNGIKWTTPIALSNDASRGLIDIDKNNNIHVIESGGSYINDRIVYHKWDGDNWTKPINISNIYSSYWPDFTIDELNIPHVVWNSYPNNRIDQEIFYNTSDDNENSWSKPTQISMSENIGSFLPNIVSKNGTIYVSWIEQEGWRGKKEILFK